MTIYILGAEKSKWHNPFSTKKYPLEDSLEMYKEHVITSGLVNDIKELKGKTLGCWCIPYSKCHGEVLVEMYNKRHYKRWSRKMHKKWK